MLMALASNIQALASYTLRPNVNGLGLEHPGLGLETPLRTNVNGLGLEHPGLGLNTP